MIAGGAPASRRGARAVLCAAAALAGLAVVLVVAGREPARSPVAGGGARVVNALPTPVAAESELRPSVSVTPRPLWQAPVAARARRDDGAAVSGPERYDSPSYEGDDWRERVAAVLGRQAVEGAPLNPGSVHTHLPSTEAATPEARAPSVLLGSAPPGSEGMEGWDGGAFWFGPNGLVKVREAQR